jgi:hypothetical protein
VEDVESVDAGHLVVAEDAVDLVVEPLECGLPTRLRHHRDVLEVPLQVDGRHGRHVGLLVQEQDDAPTSSEATLPASVLAMPPLVSRVTVCGSFT